jgi:hypothetical protein
VSREVSSQGRFVPEEGSRREDFAGEESHLPIAEELVGTDEEKMID